MAARTHQELTTTPEPTTGDSYSDIAPGDTDAYFVLHRLADAAVHATLFEQDAETTVIVVRHPAGYRL